jgi:cellulose synthase/poly-beta-1,6-N-acetylglucosamine synthase-like glycosyltransferase
MKFGTLEYHPLTLLRKDPTNFEDDQCELRKNVLLGESLLEVENIPIKRDKMLMFQGDKPKLLFCITMLNESYHKLLQSLAGIYRAYYELCAIDESYKDKCQVFILSDGYDNLSEEFLMKCESAGIFDEMKTKGYRKVKIEPGTNEKKHYYKELVFINKKNMTEGRKEYASQNLLHCFSKKMSYSDFLLAYSNDELDTFKIHNKSVFDFLLTSNGMKNSKSRTVYHLSMPVHFCIKHRNQGKIESYKWFIRGFCDALNPEYIQMIDVGSIPLRNSISKIIMHMETFPNVGGACGEIECLLSKKREDGSKTSFIESVILRSQYVEYKLSHYIDKSVESMFGFVSVLPGAFSTYRWECINGKPVEEFLKGVRDDFDNSRDFLSCAVANRYLAEDRIMCLEIIAKEN